MADLDALQRAVTRIGGTLIDFDAPDHLDAIDAWLARNGPVDEPQCGRLYWTPCEHPIPEGFVGTAGDTRVCPKFEGHLSACGPYR